MTRILFIVIVLICISNCFSYASWIRVLSPVNSTLRNCIMTDEFNAWAAGDNGVIIHSSDGGNSFVVQNSPVNYYINDIFFINNRLGWIVSNEFIPGGSTIIKTTNGGVNWIAERFFDTTKIFRTIYFLDSLTGFLGGFGGALYKTSDAGNSWHEMEIDSNEFSSFPISRFEFANGNLGFACGGIMDVAGVVWKTTDGGIHWHGDSYSPEPFFDLHVFNQSKAIVVGGDFEYGVQNTITTNGGLSWNYHSLGLFGQAYSISFRTPVEAWMALGYAETWAVTHDSGNSWITIPVTDSSDIYSVDFADSLHGIAVGLDGVILKYTNAPLGIINTEENMPVEFILHQNFPNPFNSETIISYEIHQVGFVNISIYDISGKLISLLGNGYRTPGKYDMRINAKDLAAGIYICRLVVNERKSLVVKMLLIK